jgi:hypothetical protein
MGLIPILVLLVIPMTGIEAQQPAWLPAEGEAFLVEQLVGRLSEIEGKGPESTRSDRARGSVAALRVRIDHSGPATLIARAPAFADLKMPATPSEHLNAMARYTMCSLVLALQLQTSKSLNDRLAAVLGLTATTMVILRIREPYLAGGGTDAAMEKFLSANPALEAEVERIQDSPALLTHAQSECAPVLEALIK